MLSLNEKLVLVAGGVFLGARLVDMFLFRMYAERVLWEMPWLKWLNYGDIETATKIPTTYLRRVLFAFINIGFLEFEIKDELADKPEERERLVAAMLTKENGLSFVELFKYKRVVQPKRRRRLLPSLSYEKEWAPVPT